TIYANSEDVEQVKQKLYDNITISDHAEQPQLIHTIITE
ncbi:pyrimidine-nucleoside phosphorylase, partial [Staphylococcus pseudintermedius]